MGFRRRLSLRRSLLPMWVANLANRPGAERHLHHLRLIGVLARGRMSVSNLRAWLKPNKCRATTHPRFPRLLMLKSRSAAPLRGCSTTKAIVESIHPQVSLKPRPISARDPFAPLITEAPVSSPPTAAIGKVREPAASSSQNFASHSRATDDIEIHIGRIEVTAVQPAPMRTTTVKSPRRVPSLDDYLRRRDGSI